MLVFSLFLTFIILYKTDIEKYAKKETKKNTKNQLKSIVQKIRTDKVSIFYLFYVFLGEISYNNKLTILLAFIFIELSSDAYLDITDAPYVNRYNNDEQLAFNNLKEMIEYVATAVGIFLCGIAFLYGVRYIFLIGILFIMAQIAFAYLALNLKNQENVIDKQKL